MFEWWHVTPDPERLQWTLNPLTSVGPLHFGMSPDAAARALDDLTAQQWQYTNQRSSPSSRRIRIRARHRKLGLTLYYGDEERLRGVVVDALRGPQVTAEGMALVGRMPSVLEQWMLDRAGSREPSEEIEFMGAGVPGSESLGVVVHVQRAGDHLLTRPIFVPVECLSDEGSHFLPDEVWQIWN